ncbi:MAG TPA: GatB/YqeY domain-containing protein [Bacteroidota bacterium]|nr:GatB/YqeY domain-containing protein [Bacteroidota bacterium]
MSLSEKISTDLSIAMKAGQKVRLETLRTVLAALKEKLVEKRPQGGMSEDDELTVLMQAAKKRREAADIFGQHGRKDLAALEEEELLVIQEYLPKQLTEDELGAIVRRAIASTGAAGPTDFGRVMPIVMKEVKGKIDGKLVQSTVKTLLEGPAHGAH